MRRKIERVSGEGWRTGNVRPNKHRMIKIIINNEGEREGKTTIRISEACRE